MNQYVDFERYNDHLKQILATELLPERGFYDPGMKVIHDPLWGSRLFYPWEIVLIDTPLCQRLRRIYQLGTAFLTYPSAVHTRFSHSLGVAVLAGRLITRLREKAEIQKQDVEITRKDIYTVRAAGILHDVGHFFFSHASEKVLDPIIAQFRKSLNIGKPNPHEFISYLILTNKYFEDYWESSIAPLFPQETDAPNLEDIAKIVVGISPSKEKRYLKDIIYGPYDVDKLEYLYRDARTAGLEISYDIERYFYKIRLVNDPSDTWRLAMEQGGVTAVEQLIFSKMMLFSFVYHHQKVLASDVIITDILVELLNEDPKGQIKIEHPLDFLRYTDYDILSSNLEGPSERFNSIRKRIILRDLPKRCLVISKDWVNGLKTDIDVKNNWDRLKEDLRGLPNDVEKIREEIIKIIKDKIKDKEKSQQISLNDLFVVFPKVPPIDEPAHAPVVDISGKLHPMDDFFDLEGWQTTYDLKKLRGYFYASDQIVEIASEAVESYLLDKYKLTFNKNAKIEAKMTPEMPLDIKPETPVDSLFS